MEKLAMKQYSQNIAKVMLKNEILFSVGTWRLDYITK
jgi:hypothetical protein